LNPVTPNPRKVSVAYYLTVSPGAEGEATVWDVPDGRVFRLQETHLYFPAGTYFELELRLMHGVRQVAPPTGVHRGDNMTVVDRNPAEYRSREPVVVAYKNLNTTQTREAQIVIHGQVGGD